jgi:hypothetical protein
MMNENSEMMEEPMQKNDENNSDMMMKMKNAIQQKEKNMMNYQSSEWKLRR